MPNPLAMALDGVFGIHADALRFRSARNHVLASNLANADTPNFKARDLEFADALASSASGKLVLRTTRPGHLPHMTQVGTAELKYRNPYQPTLDGNTVEAEVEQAQFAENAVRYQASLMFLSGKITGLRDALTGGQ